MKNPKNLAEGLAAEIESKRDLLKLYEDAGPLAQFGAMTIKLAIEAGEDARTNHDVVAMAVAYKSLTEITG